MERVQVDTGLVYKTVADTLPQEGRDFSLGAESGPDNQKKLVVTALTDLGRAWVPFLKANLQDRLKSQGVETGEAERKPDELITVRTVREQVEAEEKATLAKRISEADAAAKEAVDNFESLKRSQSGDGTGTSVSNHDIAESKRKADEAKARASHLRKVASLVDAVRSEVEARAAEAAAEDGKNGKDWSFDPDAQLTSLFERQDVSQKIRMKESLIGRIADNDAVRAGLLETAVNVAKQYAITKGDK